MGGFVYTMRTPPPRYESCSYCNANFTLGPVTIFFTIPPIIKVPFWTHLETVSGYARLFTAQCQALLARVAIYLLFKCCSKQAVAISI
jgi:hypothetical protein